MSGRVLSKVGAKAESDVCVLVLPVKRDGSTGLAFTDNDGHYRVPHLATGKYKVYFADPSCAFFEAFVPPYAPQWYRGRLSEARATTVHVSAGTTTTGIGAALAPFGAVTGTVETRGLGVVSGECVTAVPFGADIDPVTLLPAQPELAITDRTGRYTLTALMPGLYKIEFSTGCGATGFATQWWPNAASPKSAQVVTVGFATVSGVDAALRR